ncbi:glycosyltransferase family 2 protein [Beijerinckia indica]|nr:glycosyltransferase family 2 protein [Beijerinckia indica]
MNMYPPSDHFFDRPLASVGEALQLPLVSVIIVNYNYGRYLRQAVASILEQTYERIECIIVDNASTDESGQILDEMEADNSPVTIIRRAHNDGQTPASLDGFKASNGAYVIFLDADDILLPRGVETHIFVHLSMRSHVGFTSGDMLQVEGDQIVVTGGNPFNDYIRSGKGIRQNLTRPYHHHADDPSTRNPGLDEIVLHKVHYVRPLAKNWVWSPTSGNCFRRDALRLFADNPSLATLRTGTDMYFALGISALCGSVLIDEPVFAYRIHGNNIFTRHAQLNRILCYDPGGSGDSNDQAKRFLVDHLVIHAKRFTQNTWLRLNFVLLLARLDQIDPDPSLPRWAARSRLAQRLVEHYSELEPILGFWKLRAMLLYKRVPLSIIFGLGSRQI